MELKRWLAVAGLGLALAACGGKTEEGPKKPAVYLTGEAASKWDTLCVSCHGKKGVGDGVAAGSLKVKPRSFADQAWQGSVTDEHLAKVIVEGGKAVGKSELMPASPDLKDKPAVVADLVKKIRSL